MKKIIMLSLLLLIGNLLIAQSPGVLPTGSDIPMAATAMKSVTGSMVTIQSQVKKNGVLVMFSCNTCPYVVKYQKRTAAILKKAALQDIGVIIINSNEEYRTAADSYEAMKKYAVQQGYKVPYVVDEKSVLADAFGATRTPECFLFSAAGKLIYHGAIDDNATAIEVSRTHLTTAMDQALAGKPIEINETRSIGCMIKRAE